MAPIATSTQCEGCGLYHGPVEHEIECLRRHLREARARPVYGVSAEQYAANVKQSENFRKTRVK